MSFLAVLLLGVTAPAHAAADRATRMAWPSPTTTPTYAYDATPNRSDGAGFGGITGRALDRASGTAPACELSASQAVFAAADTAGAAIPKESQEVIQSIRENGVIAQGGVRGPAVPEEFANDGRNGSAILPRGTASDPITYREWGTIPDPANPKPGGERIVTGSDGSAYYSPDHYKTFIPYP